MEDFLVRVVGILAFGMTIVGLISAALLAMETTSLLRLA